jgi:hypothetical protein
VAIGAAIVLGVLALMSRRKRGMAGGDGRGPFGSGPSAGGPMANTGSGPGQGPGMQPGWGPGMQPGYGPGPAQPGMGSSIGRGLATGLAVGAGAVAAGEIGRRLLHPDGTPVAPDAAGTSAWDDAGANADMGGRDFGIDETGSWDTGGGVGGVDTGNVDPGGGLDSGDVGGGDWNT